MFFSGSQWQDPNQFIRASALRVLSSIRVPIIVPIMMLAIKEAAADLSPYVRKTSAHAIQKLYRCGSNAGAAAQAADVTVKGRTLTAS